MSNLLPNPRQISNEPLALVGVLVAIATQVLVLADQIEASGATDWVSIGAIVVTFVARLFVNGPDTAAEKKVDEAISSRRI